MTHSDTDQALPAVPTPERAATPETGAPSSSRRGSSRRGSVALVAAACLIAIAGYAVGNHASTAPVVIHHGTAMMSRTQISVIVDDIGYAIPLDVTWQDSAGTMHTGGRPSCLPATASSAPVTFGAVQYQSNKVGGYAVVWVDCS